MKWAQKETRKKELSAGEISASFEILRPLEKW